MSTGIFSSDHTSGFLMPIIYFLFPWLLPANADLIHWSIRKFAHILMYFTFGILIYRALCSNEIKKWCLRLSAYSVVLLAVFAMLDELHQALLPTRTFLFSDVAIDVVSGIISQIAIGITYGIHSHHKEA